MAESHDWANGGGKAGGSIDRKEVSQIKSDTLATMSADDGDELHSALIQTLGILERGTRELKAKNKDLEEDIAVRVERQTELESLVDRLEGINDRYVEENRVLQERVIHFNGSLELLRTINLQLGPLSKSIDDHVRDLDNKRATASISFCSSIPCTSVSSSSSSSPSTSVPLLVPSVPLRFAAYTPNPAPAPAPATTLKRSRWSVSLGIDDKNGRDDDSADSTDEDKMAVVPRLAAVLVPRNHASKRSKRGKGDVDDDEDDEEDEEEEEEEREGGGGGKGDKNDGEEEEEAEGGAGGEKEEEEEEEEDGGAHHKGPLSVECVSTAPPHRLIARYKSVAAAATHTAMQKPVLYALCLQAKKSKMPKPGGGEPGLSWRYGPAASSLPSSERFSSMDVEALLHRLKHLT